jgi:hypothetical protein
MFKLLRKSSVLVTLTGLVLMWNLPCMPVYAQAEPGAQEGFFGQETVNTDVFGNQVKHTNKPKKAVRSSQKGTSVQQLLQQRMVQRQEQQKPAHKEHNTLVPEIGQTNDSFASVSPIPAPVSQTVPSPVEAPRSFDPQQPGQLESFGAVAELGKRLERVQESTQGQQSPLKHYEEIIQNIEKAAPASSNNSAKDQGSYRF